MTGIELDRDGNLIRRCADCREPITGAIWGPGPGRCLDCHERSLLPPDQWGEPWGDVYLGNPFDD